MKHTEYIVPIGEDAQDYDEMFIAVIRRQPELIRCKDCKHYDKSEDTPYCLRAMWWQDEGDDWFCAGAERKDHETD